MKYVLQKQFFPGTVELQSFMWLIRWHSFSPCPLPRYDMRYPFFSHQTLCLPPTPSPIFNLLSHIFCLSTLAAKQYPKIPSITSHKYKGPIVSQDQSVKKIFCFRSVSPPIYFLKGGNCGLTGGLKVTRFCSLVVFRCILSAHTCYTIISFLSWPPYPSFLLKFNFPSLVGQPLTLDVATLTITAMDEEYLRRLGKGKWEHMASIWASSLRFWHMSWLLNRSYFLWKHRVALRCVHFRLYQSNTSQVIIFVRFINLKCHSSMTSRKKVS